MTPEPNGEQSLTFPAEGETLSDARVRFDGPARGRRRPLDPGGGGWLMTGTAWTAEDLIVRFDDV